MNDDRIHALEARHREMASLPVEVTRLAGECVQLYRKDSGEIVRIHLSLQYGGGLAVKLAERAGLWYLVAGTIGDGEEKMAFVERGEALKVCEEIARFGNGFNADVEDLGFDDSAVEVTAHGEAGDGEVQLFRKGGGELKIVKLSRYGSHDLAVRRATVVGGRIRYALTLNGKPILSFASPREAEDVCARVAEISGPRSVVRGLTLNPVNPPGERLSKRSGLLAIVVVGVIVGLFLLGIVQRSSDRAGGSPPVTMPSPNVGEPEGVTKP